MKSAGLLCIIVIFLYRTAHAERTIWYVHPDSTLNTIQAGLDSCADDDIVLVGPGTYYENIIWPNTQGIHLVSELGPELTIIDGGNPSNPDSASVVAFMSGQDTTSVLNGFTIQHGSGIYIGGGTAGGGIYCCSNSSPTISYNRIAANRAHGGGGIYCYNSSPSITGNAIANNKANQQIGAAMGGGIWCRNSSPTIQNNSITDNLALGNNAARGGAIFCDSGSSPIIEDNCVVGNAVTGYSCNGSAITCDHYSSPAIVGNIITDNGQLGIGAATCCVSSGTIVNNIISENQTHGIVCTGYFSLTIRGNTITENGQCGIECRAQSSPYIDSCIISGNNSHGISCWGGGDPTVIHCNIYGNMGYGLITEDTISVSINAEHNWWGDASGPYHPTANPGGLGDSVSDYVDFNPWLTDSVQWLAIEEQSIVKSIVDHRVLPATIFRGPLRLPEDKKCRIFDITGRIVEPDNIQPGIYFIEVDGVVAHKVVKVR